MDEDLYGDLDTSTSALVKTEALQQKQRVESENEKLRKELAVLQHENRELGERNKALETNISSLFVTAQHELKRKDAEIQRLRDELERDRKTDRGNTAPRHSHSQDPQRHDRDRDRDSAHSRSTSSYGPSDTSSTHRRASPPAPPRPTSRERDEYTSMDGPSDPELDASTRAQRILLRHHDESLGILPAY